MYRFLLLLHLVAVVVWIGGMFFAHFCLRPAAAELLQPPQRLPLLQAVLGRFFIMVSAALVLLWGSGIVLFASPGPLAPVSRGAMAAIAAVMTAIFLIIVLRPYPKMKQSIATADWAAAGKAMNSIRMLVLANLVLGFVTIAVAML